MRIYFLKISSQTVQSAKKIAKKTLESVSEASLNDKNSKMSRKLLKRAKLRSEQCHMLFFLSKSCGEEQKETQRKSIARFQSAMMVLTTKWDIMFLPTIHSVFFYYFAYIFFRPNCVIERKRVPKSGNKTCFETVRLPAC